MTDQQESPESGTQPMSQTPAYPPVDPRLLAAMYGMAQEGGTDLLVYWGIIKKRWKLLASMTLAAAAISAGISLRLPNIYQAQVLMAPITPDQVSSGASSGLGAVLDGGGLAALAGVNLGNSNSPEQNLAVLRSRGFLWNFIKDDNLMPILFAKDWDVKKKAWKERSPKQQPSLWRAYRMLRGKVLSVRTDRETGLVTVSVDWTDPALAANWANELVDRLNDYLRRNAIGRSEANLKYLNAELSHTSLVGVRQATFALIAQEQKKAMLASTQKEFAFRIIDPAVPPDIKSKPRRSMIVLTTTLVAGLLAMLFSVFKERTSQADA